MAVPKATAPALVGVNFGDLGMYAGGQFVPDGDYSMTFDVLNYQAKKADGSPAGPIRLGVLVTYLPLTEPTEENKKLQFYSMGSNADKCFAPNADTGKGLVVIPGAPSTTLNDKTNWALLLKSLYDSGLPQGIFTNDLGVLDGTWVHITNVEEPEERKGFQSNTAEVAAQTPRQPGKVAIVTEIKDDGKPWEGTGGIPTTPTAPAKTAPKVNGAPVTRPAMARPTAPAPVTTTDSDVSEETRVAAISAMSDVLMKKPAGCLRTFLRTETFKLVKAATKSDEAANAVLNAYFEGGGDALSNLLGELGYAVSGPGPAAQVKPLTA